MTDQERQKLINDAANAHDVASDRVWRTVQTIIGHQHFTDEQKIAALHSHSTAVENQRGGWRDHSGSITVSGQEIIDFITNLRDIKELVGDNTSALDMLLTQIHYVYTERQEQPDADQTPA